jgi:chemotaxis signal transduction protein
MTSQQRFVLFPLGEKRFALPAELVAELARPDTTQSFPHTTPLVTGVLVRRGYIVPVCDIAEVLVGNNVPARKFYLIANRNFDDQVELTALPVTGECELAAADMKQPTGRLPEYVIGLLCLPTEIIEVLNLEKLIAKGACA